MPYSRPVSPTSLFTIPLVAALALALGACDKPDRAETTGAPTEAQDLAARKAAFEQDVRDLKAKGLASAKLVTAFAEARVRHGFPLPANVGEATGKTAPLAKPAMALGALTKTAATISDTETIRTGHFGFVPTVTFDVPAGDIMTAWTEHTGAEDPMLVGYYKTADLGGSRYTTQDIGVSDDEGGGTDAYLKWKNTTGAKQTITLVAFAYNSAATGKASLTYHAWGTPTQTRTFSMTAYQMNDYDYVGTPTGCTGPAISILSLVKNGWQSSEYGVLAVNTTTHRGGWIYEEPGKLALEDILPRDFSSFILPYMIVDPGSPVFEAASYTASQRDVFSCPG